MQGKWTGSVCAIVLVLGWLRWRKTTARMTVIHA